MSSAARKATLAIGPEMPGWGSWEWVGADVARELAKYFRVVTCPPSVFPDADVVVVVKHPPSAAWAGDLCSGRFLRIRKGDRCRCRHAPPVRPCGRALRRAAQVFRAVRGTDYVATTLPFPARPPGRAGRVLLPASAAPFA
jgi:hypothetical protein